MTSILYARKLKLQNNRLLPSKLLILFKNNISSKLFLTKSFLDPNKITNKKLSTIPLSKKILLMQIMKRNQNLRRYKNQQKLRTNKSQRTHILQAKPILQLNHCSRSYHKKKKKLLSMKFLTMLMNLISNFSNKVLLNIHNKKRLKKKLNLMFQSMEMKQIKNLHKTKLKILKIKLKIMFNLKFNNMNNLKFRKNNLKLKNRPNIKLSKNSQNLNDVNNYLSTTFFIFFSKKK